MSRRQTGGGLHRSRAVTFLACAVHLGLVFSCTVPKAKCALYSLGPLPFARKRVQYTQKAGLPPAQVNGKRRSTSWPSMRSSLSVDYLRCFSVQLCSFCEQAAPTRATRGGCLPSAKHPTEIPSRVLLVQCIASCATTWLKPHLQSCIQRAACHLPLSLHCPSWLEKVCACKHH